MRNYRPRTSAEAEESWRNPAEADMMMSEQVALSRKVRALMSEYPNLSVDAAALAVRMDVEAEALEQLDDLPNEAQSRAPEARVMMGELAHAQVMAVLESQGISNPRDPRFSNAYRLAMAELDGRQRLQDGTLIERQSQTHAKLSEEVGSHYYTTSERAEIQAAVERFGERGRKRASEFQRRFREESDRYRRNNR